MDTSSLDRMFGNAFLRCCHYRPTKEKNRPVNMCWGKKNSSKSSKLKVQVHFEHAQINQKSDHIAKSYLIAPDDQLSLNQLTYVLVC